MVDVEVLDSTADTESLPNLEEGIGIAVEENNKPETDTESDSDQAEDEDGTDDEVLSGTAPEQEEKGEEDLKDKEDVMIATVRAFLEGENMDYTTKNPDEDTYLFFAHLTGKDGSFKTMIDIKPKQKRVLVMVESPVKIPPHRRSIAAEFLMRVNYTLAVGAFEMDFRDGEVRNRSSVEMNDGILTNEMVRSLIMIPAATIDRFFNALMEVVYGNRNPEEAYERARNPSPGAPSRGNPGAAQSAQLLTQIGGE